MRLIDADALKKHFPKDVDWEAPVNTNEYVCECIDNAPTVEPFERIGAICNENCGYKPQGKWIMIKPFYELIDGHYQETQSKLDFVKCPFCETIYHGRHNFCGRCGADMRGKE